MKKFEYYAHNGMLDQTELNDLGIEGWELVSHTGVAGYSEIQQYYVFKRRIEIICQERMDII